MKSLLPLFLASFLCAFAQTPIGGGGPNFPDFGSDANPRTITLDVVSNADNSIYDTTTATINGSDGHTALTASLGGLVEVSVYLINGSALSTAPQPYPYSPLLFGPTTQLFVIVSYLSTDPGDPASVTLGDYSIRLSNLFKADNTPVNNLHLDNHGGRMFNDEFTFPDNPATSDILSFTTFDFDDANGVLTFHIGAIADLSDFPNLEITQGTRYAFTGNFPGPIGAPIPEPATVAGFLGAAALGFACWRRSRRA